MHRAAAILTFLTPGLRFFHQGQREGKRVRIPVHLGRGPDEATDAGIAAFYDGLLECLKDPAFRDGDWQLLECRPAWDGNGTWDAFVAFSWTGPGERRRLVAVNYAGHQSQCYVAMPWRDLDGRTWRLQDLTGPAVYDRQGSDLTLAGPLPRHARVGLPRLRRLARASDLTMLSLLLKEIRHNPLLWLLVFVPVVFAAEKLAPDAHTLLFVLSVLAIVPLAALLSHATESVAAKTGDAVGGLLNATLGNLTELVIALAALRAGQYMLVKASIAGAIVTNTLFMLGASFLLGGLKHRVQEYNRVGARFQAALLFLATIALLVPSAIAEADRAPAARSRRR